MFFLQWECLSLNFHRRFCQISAELSCKSDNAIFITIADCSSVTLVTKEQTLLNDPRNTKVDGIMSNKIILTLLLIIWSELQFPEISVCQSHANLRIGLVTEKKLVPSQKSSQLQLARGISRASTLRVDSLTQSLRRSWTFRTSQNVFHLEVRVHRLYRLPEARIS